jgi:hypothetical protein
MTVTVVLVAVATVGMRIEAFTTITTVVLFSVFTFVSGTAQCILPEPVLPYEYSAYFTYWKIIFEESVQFFIFS